MKKDSPRKEAARLLKEADALGKEFRNREALPLYKAAGKIYEQLGDLEKTSHALSGIAASYFYTKRPKESVPYIHKLQELNSAPERREYYLGTLFLEIELYSISAMESQKTLELLKTGLNLATKWKLSYYKHLACYLHAMIYHKQKDYSSALDLYIKAAKIAKQNGHHRGAKLF